MQTPTDSRVPPTLPYITTDVPERYTSGVSTIYLLDMREDIPRKQRALDTYKASRQSAREDYNPSEKDSPLLHADHNTLITQQSERELHAEKTR